MQEEQLALQIQQQMQQQPPFVPSSDRARASNQLEIIADNLQNSSDMAESMVVIEGLDNEPVEQIQPR